MRRGVLLIFPVPWWPLRSYPPDNPDGQGRDRVRRSIRSDRRSLGSRCHGFPVNLRSGERRARIRAGTSGLA